MYRLGGAKEHGVFLGAKFIPEVPDNRDWMEYQKWLGDGNSPAPALPEPAAEIPEPTVSEIIDALEAKDLGDTTKWDAVRARKRLLK